jgi:tRNA(Arg) A34 adenosine deaminase TadA
VTRAPDASTPAVRYSPEDDAHLLAAIQLSKKIAERGDLPFAALLVDAAGNVVLEAGNTMVTTRDVTAHAEMNLVRAASACFEPDYIADCTLYASAEPCAMCAGAIYWGNIRRVVHGIGTRALHEVIGSSYDVPVLELPCNEVFARCGHHVELIGPHREAESRAVHEWYWSGRLGIEDQGDTGRGSD